MVRRPIDRYGFLDAPGGRRLRGRRIAAALAEFGGLDIVRSRILDVGCSAGLITEELAQRVALAIGVDVDVDALVAAATRGGRARFAAAAGARLPFAEATFDAVVCNHVYEHVPDPAALMRDVHRVLRVGGVCYFAGGHVLQLIEPHHRLPLLSWLPRRIAGGVLRTAGRADRYDERFLPPWRLRRLFEPFARADFVSPRMLRAPDRYEFASLARIPAFARPALEVFAGAAARLAPTWIYVLRK